MINLAVNMDNETQETQKPPTAEEIEKAKQRKANKQVNL